MNARGRNGRGRQPMNTEQRGFRLATTAQAIALILAARGAVGQAQAAPAFGSAWFATMGANQNSARTTGMVNGRPVSNFPSGQQQVQQANLKLQKSIADLALAAQGIAARQAMAGGNSGGDGVPDGVSDGLGAGGLSVDTNSLTKTWLNAQAPTQSVDGGGHVTVNVQQTAARAILSWSSFNVGKNTTLNFDQSAGTQGNGANDWAVLNRINDPGGKPSQILGSITAQGSVYVINRNGIVFGGGSQVNVHALVASSLDFLNMNDDLVQTPADVAASNSQFMLSGLVGPAPAGASGRGGGTEVLGLGNTVSVSSASQYQVPGDILIDAGATITTHANGAVSDGGFVLIAAPNVSNGGTITTTNGQAILAAGVGVGLVPSDINPQQLLPVLSGRILLDDGKNTDVTPVGTLTNKGLVQASRGVINLLGSNVNQDGAVGVTTGVSYPGGITITTVDEVLSSSPCVSTDSCGAENYLDAGGNILSGDLINSPPANRRAGQLIFGPGSLTVDLPDNDGETTTSDRNVSVATGSISLAAGSVWFQNGSLLDVPGASVTVAAFSGTTAMPPGDTGVQGRIYLDTGATVDVAGLANVALPVSDMLVTIPLIGQNELADSPLLRDSFLAGLANVVIDSTRSGVTDNGTPWVGSPVLNAQGYVDLIPRSIDQLLTNGGSITLSGAQVMTAAGSAINLDGGYTHYLGGYVKTTVLEDQYGRMVPIGQADPDDLYVGIAGQYISNHARWGVSETYDNPLIGRAVYEDDLVVGGNAGTLNVFGSQAVVLDGALSGQAVAGTRQVQDNSVPSGGTFALGAGASLTTADPSGGAPTFNGVPGSVIFQGSAPLLSSLAPDFGADTPLDAVALNALPTDDPDNVLAWQTMPVNTLNAGGFSNVSVVEDDRVGKSIVVAAGTQLTVQPGGSIALSAPSIEVLGSLTAPAGNISITGIGGGDITVGQNANVSVAGLWINNAVSGTSGAGMGGSEYINGGTIALSVAGSVVTTVTDTSRSETDATGSIFLQAGSLLDVSSGGYVQADGQLLMKNDLPQGIGGSISLLTYDNESNGYAAPTTPPSTGGRIVMDGIIKSAGFAGGGTLTLQALGFQIGGNPAAAPVWDEYLPADFFASQGFGNYVLNAMYGVDIAPGTVLRLTQQDLIPNVAALQVAATGTDIVASAMTTLGALDPYYRPATGLIMTGGGYLGWVPSADGQWLDVSYTGVPSDVTVGAGASIVADAGAAIGLASATRVAVLGSILAPGGVVTLSADTRDFGFDVAGQAIVGSGFDPRSQSVWLGAGSVVDVAGVALTNPFAPFVRSGADASQASGQERFSDGPVAQADTGRVLPGGSVVISDDVGYVVAQTGSRIDVSGASAVIDEPQAGGGYAAQQVWSDAGSITLGAASGLYFNATLQAQPGAAQAQGGTLTILPEQGALTSILAGGAQVSTPGATALIIQQSGEPVPGAVAPGDNFTDGTPTGILQFAADRLEGSGIATLVLGGSGGKGYTAAPVPIAFAGDVDLTLGNAVIINTAQLIALPAGSTSIPSLAAGVSTVGGATVEINAPYVALAGPEYISGGPAQTTAVEALADGTLNINASFIDLENQIALANFGQANFTSSGDIRLSSTNSVNPAFQDGALFTSGNLTLQAADLYPASGSTFILDAVGPVDALNQPTPTNITFLSNGASDVPLSAGGSLLIDATNIVQSGTVRAPSGRLVFGVGDASDADTQTQFGGSLPLANTQSVTFAEGSITSVSNGDTVIPYGTTVDGTEWQYNVAGSTSPDLASPPSKFVSVNGSAVSLNAGATIDLSGGGDLQAEEWVPGTGGSRDVLSQYNISYETSAAGTAAPTLPGAANIYAIVPGYHAPVAAYDPVFAKVTQPSTDADGSASTATQSIGIGQAALTSQVGAAVYLQGIKGLPDGVYTLLPAKYATLPGAYRVTVASAATTVAPGTHVTAPDGTQVVAGYMANALTGNRNATPLLFDVQSSAVWQQYSQYTLTSANGFFPSLAAAAGNATPPLPMDAGQLVLAASQSLTLGAALRTSAAPGGAPAQVDIASQAIQIVGNGEAALPGYLQLSADQLNALDAGSLLIGGTRTQTTSGITIDAIANSVVVSNDAADPLAGPEIMLVSANNLRVDPASVITATGAYPAARDVPISIGSSASGLSGDGAFLSVTNGGDAPVLRQNTTGIGALTVGAGAILTGGAALTLDSSGDLTFDPAANLSGNVIAVDGSAIVFTDQSGAAAASLPGFVVGPNQVAQLANAQQVILRSAGVMTFDGSTDVTFGNAVDLSAGVFQSDGGSATINAREVTLSNETGASDKAGTSGVGTLIINAAQINFGNGNATVAGFGNATLNATGAIVGQGNGTFDFGALPVVLNAPVYLAATGSESTIRTTGELDLNSEVGAGPALQSLGGALSFTGGTVNDNGATIEAPAGNVSIEATSGDLNINSGSVISSAGVALAFFDVTEYAPAGAITLTADRGAVNVQSGSNLDFSGAVGGGAAGSLALTAPNETVQLAGTLNGNAANGFLGGAFALNTGGAVDLDSLAGELASSGVNDQIVVKAGAGNLLLSAGNTLAAHTVSLTADGGAGGQNQSDGNVQILGTINAAGNAGGEIDLYGKSGVDVEGALVATGSSATQRGGIVTIGTTGNGSTTDLNPIYGYENILPATGGSIIVGTNATIDVSGGSSGGLSGGTVNFRAPILADGTVNVSISPSARISGSRATTLEAYAVWSTDDQSTNAAQHFDGVVDPAGWYVNSVAGAGQPGMVVGTWADQSGNTLPDPTGANQLADYLANDFFTPAAGATNTDHQTFFGYQSDGTTPGTLMGFVEHGVQSVANQFANTGIKNFTVTPGIELDNPDSTINNGDISVLTNWNLGAGTSATNLAFRFNGQAPIVTLRAENNVNVDASLTDGFFQIANPTASSIPGGTAATAFGFYEVYYHGYASFYNDYGLHTQGPSSTLAPGDATPQEIAQYYGLYDEYAKYLAGPDDPIVASAAGPNFPGELDTGVLILQGIRGWSTSGGTPPPGQPVAPTPPTQAQQLADPASYQTYLKAYEKFFDNTVLFFQATGSTPVVPELAAPAPVAGPPAPGPTDNSPPPVSASSNSLPLLLASLNNGNSASWRIVSGANLASADPLAVQPASALPPLTAADGAEVGSVKLDGHFGFDAGGAGAAIFQPTMIRTGTGFIDIASANNFTLDDTTAPGVIYTAGVAAAGSPTAGPTVSIDQPVSAGGPAGVPSFVLTPAVNPTGAGDISIQVRNDITGIENLVDSTGSITGVQNANYSQFWWQWMELGNVVNTNGQITQTSIDFGAFDQGVLSMGGNVSVRAGGNVTDLAVSLPTTWYLASDSSGVVAPTVVGGGNLTVQAGGNILSGDYFVANGTGSISAGGSIASDGLAYTIPIVNVSAGPVSTLLATQNGVLNVTARAGIDIGGVIDPSYIEGQLLSAFGQHADSQGYSSSSAVNVAATTGNVDFGSLGASSVFARLLIGDAPSGAPGSSANAGEILPPTLSLAAFSGGINVSSAGELYPSATGELSLIADQTIDLSAGAASDRWITFGLIDADPSEMPSPTDPLNMNSSNGAGSGFLFGSLQSIASLLHAESALHAGDTQPVRVYSLDGNIINGATGATGTYSEPVDLDVDKPAQIYAGGNIVNLAFTGQNLAVDDVTRIIAGGNIDDAPSASFILGEGAVIPSLVLGGPGTFDIEAGGNIGPLANQTEYAGSVTGIDAIGNVNNPFLPHESASIQVLYGVAPGIDNQAFISAYIDPANTAAGVPSATPALIAFMQQYDAGHGVDTGLASDKAAAQADVGTLSADQAWRQFQALPAYVQQIFTQQVLLSVLADVGQDYNDESSPFFHQYSRGYQAINTLFPASLGYTANNLAGGDNGANQLITTGNLDIRSSTIQTQQGGNISILGPGGEALVGSISAPPEIVDSQGHVLAGPNTMGILTLEQGNVNIFTDQSLLLAQSRIFTEQGGDMTIWSSNGDINAGKGSKSVADVPPPIYVCDANHYCTVDARGAVTGAGIATLQTVPGSSTGDINLLAPRGTVDAGDAGIRVSGDINIAALAVANAANIQVQGKSTGIPLLAQVNVAALTSASTAATAAANAAENVVHQQQAAARQALPSIITVQVLGFGDDSTQGASVAPASRPLKPKLDSVSYDPANRVQVVGHGSSYKPALLSRLTDDERRKLLQDR